MTPQLKPRMFPDHEARFVTWLTGRIPGATEVTLDLAEQFTFGYSNQTWNIAISWTADGSRHSERMILRCPPDGTGLLEPYDVGKQYRVMKALDGGAVPVPRMFWLDESGDVLGRPFYLMERLNGQGIEWQLSDFLLAAAPASIRHICEQYVDAIAAVHLTDWRTIDTGLPQPASDPLLAEIDWWDQAMRALDPGPIPSFELIASWLRANRPAGIEPRLVHGDPKLGNLLLDGDRLIALIDWEMATIGDPMCDLGWMAFLWFGPFNGGFSDLPGAMSWDELAARYTEKTGLPVRDIGYYKVLQGYKAAAICFVGYLQALRGETTDPRFEGLGATVPPQVDKVLAELDALGTAHGPLLDPFAASVAASQ